MQKLLVSGLMSLSLMLAGCGGGSTAPEGSQDSPEQVVNAFYTAFMQDPDSALIYVDPEVVDTEDFQGNWEEMSTWTFTKAEVVSTDGNEVTVDIEVMIEGETDGGTDQVEVVEKDSKWWIVSLPG